MKIKKDTAGFLRETEV